MSIFLYYKNHKFLDLQNIDVILLAFEKWMAIL